MFKNTLCKLVVRNLSLWQIVAFVIANLLGGFVVLSGIRAYDDFHRFTQKESGLIDGYVVITKPVTGLNTLGSLMGLRPNFSINEIKSIEEHPLVKRVGPFIFADFNVHGRFSLGDYGISTEMFIESVPDEFLDVEFKSPDIWSAKLDSTYLPIIIPRKYLNLYNYGFAASRGLPPMSESLAAVFPITITLYGRGEVHSYNAKIVGFTERLNTILVPDTFLKSANLVFAGNKQTVPSRLVVSIKRDADINSFMEFIDFKGYKIEGDAESLRLNAFVYGVLWVVIGVGALVSLLAFFLLVISISLLIEKNRERFVNLFALGYTVKEIAAPYLLLVALTDVFVWAFALVAVLLLYPQLFSFVTVISKGFAFGSSLLVCVAAGVFAMLFVLLHSRIVVANIKRVVLR